MSSSTAIAPHHESDNTSIMNHSTTTAGAVVLRNALRAYCQHVYDFVSEVNVVLASPASTTFPTAVDTDQKEGAAGAVAAAADEFTRAGQLLSRLSHYRTTLADILKTLGVDALETFASTTVVRGTIETPCKREGDGAEKKDEESVFDGHESDAAVAGASGLSSSTVVEAAPASATTSTTTVFSVPSLISQIDRMLPKIASSATASTTTKDNSNNTHDRSTDTTTKESAAAGGEAKSEHASVHPATFTDEEKSELLRTVILNGTLQQTLATQIFEFAAATSKAKRGTMGATKRSREEITETMDNSKSSSSAFNNGENVERDVAGRTSANTNDVTTAPQHFSVLSKKFREKKLAQADLDEGVGGTEENRSNKAHISEGIKEGGETKTDTIEETTVVQPLTRNTTVFVRNTSSSTTTASLFGGEKAPQHRNNVSTSTATTTTAAVLSACQYDSLLADYSLNISAVAALPTVAKRQEAVSTCIDVIMRSMITATSNVQVPTSSLFPSSHSEVKKAPTTPSSSVNGAAATTTANSSSTPSTTLTPTASSGPVAVFTPSFHSTGLPFRYLQVTGQGGGSVAANTFAPLRFT